MAPLSPQLRAELDQLLAAHAPADSRERDHLGQIIAFVQRHPDPFDRQLPQGHLTGSAFVIDPRHRLLLTHHRRLDLWIQLGGHAEDERRACEVALREAREESGLGDLAFHPALTLPDGAPALFDVDVHPIPARGAEPAHLHLDLRFLLVTASPHDIRRDPAESHELDWFPLPRARRRADPGLSRALDKLDSVIAGDSGQPN